MRGKVPKAKKKGAVRGQKGASAKVKKSGVNGPRRATGAARVLRAMVLLLRGMRPVDVYPILEQEFSIGRTQAGKDVAQANRDIRAEYDARREIEAARSAKRLADIFEQQFEAAASALEVGDFRGSSSCASAARGAVAELNKLMGLHAPAKVEHSGQVLTGPDLSHLNPEDRAKLRAIIARAKARAEAEAA